MSIFMLYGFLTSLLCKNFLSSASESETVNTSRSGRGKSEKIATGHGKKMIYQEGWRTQNELLSQFVIFCITSKLFLYVCVVQKVMCPLRRSSAVQTSKVTKSLTWTSKDTFQTHICQWAFLGWVKNWADLLKLLAQTGKGSKEAVIMFMCQVENKYEYDFFCSF